MQKNITLLSGIILLFVTSFCWIANAQTPSVFCAEEASYSIFINNNKTNFQSSVLNVDGKTYVHIRDLSDIFGYEVSWDANENTVQIATDMKDHQISKELALQIVKSYLQEKYPEFMKDKVCAVDEVDGDLSYYQITCSSHSQVIASNGEVDIIPLPGDCITVSIDKYDCRILSEIWGE